MSKRKLIGLNVHVLSKMEAFKVKGGHTTDATNKNIIIEDLVIN